jgi:predicted nucleotidyltransferase
LRLSSQEKNNLLRGLFEFSEVPSQAKVFLFGSRADATKLGGDIDLLLLVPSNSLNVLQGMKHRLLVNIKKYLDEQKVDLTILPIETCQNHPFYQSIESQLIRLTESN